MYMVSLSIQLPDRFISFYPSKNPRRRQCVFRCYLRPSVCCPL